MRKIYDFFLEKTVMPWGEYLGQYKSCGKKVQEAFLYSIYPKIGLELIIITLVSLTFYYLYLNNRFGRYYSNKAWFTTLFLTASIVGIFTYITTNNIIGDPSCSVFSQMGWISFINFLFSLIIFIVFSFLFRLGSSMGKRTPYLTTN